MDFSAQTTTDGVLERRFTYAGVPGALFSPSSGGQGGPLVLLAHGGGRHATHPATTALARHYVGAYGWSVLALDAPGHGGRPRSDRLQAAVAAMRAAMAAGSPGAAVAAMNAEVAAAAVPEWRAAIDAVLTGGYAVGPVGFIGFSLGAAIGVPLIAAEARITAAVIGLVAGRGLHDDAARITVPVQVVAQWDDELVDRDEALALFAAIGSGAKSLHVNSGGHQEVPAHQRASSEAFLARHLDVAGTAEPDGARADPREETVGQRLRRAVVLGVEEDSCEVLLDDQRVSARYARAFPSPRTERVAPGHLVALATADDGAVVVVFRWYDALVLGATGDQVQMWEPTHGQVTATPRRPDQHYQVGTRAYLSAGLPGAEWWLAGPVTATAQQADVELDQVERFCAEHHLFDQLG